MKIHSSNLSPFQITVVGLSNTFVFISSDQWKDFRLKRLDEQLRLRLTWQLSSPCRYDPQLKATIQMILERVSERTTKFTRVDCSHDVTVLTFNRLPFCFLPPLSVDYFRLDAFEESPLFSLTSMSCVTLRTLHILWFAVLKTFFFPRLTNRFISYSFINNPPFLL